MSTTESTDAAILQALLKRAERDPRTTLEFIPQTDGILSGVQELLTRLRSLHPAPFQLWALEEGATFTGGEVVLRWRGHLLQLTSHIAGLTGLLGASSGWTTAARTLVETAKPIPLILSPTDILYPDGFLIFEHATLVGGCIPSTSPLRQGLISRNLILLMGDTLLAAQSFDELLEPALPRLIRVDTVHDDADEAVRVALALGDKLTGVVLEAGSRHNVVSSDLLQTVRGQLDLAGFPRVKIFVDGHITIETVTRWNHEHAPIDGFFVGDTLAAATPIPFHAELKEMDGKPIARRGLVPGTTPNLRLKKIDVD